jgi:3-methyl-2-oxobutanoate hydroxymethyltransferase
MGGSRMSKLASETRPRQSVPKIRARKGGEPLVCLTAYTAPMAALIDSVADLILVGDSVANVLHGHRSTIPVTLDDMILHAKAVLRAEPRALVGVDLPFGSYEASPEQAYTSAARVLKETGADAVKLEGGARMAPTIAFLVERAVPVIGHIGLLPQSVRALGGPKVAGRDRAEWPRLMADAKAVEAAGAFAIVLEGVVEEIAAEITRTVLVPTIGIGASPACDGQIIVTEDMLGLFETVAKFVRPYGNLRGDILKALNAFAADVRARRFPSAAETYGEREGR